MALRHLLVLDAGKVLVMVVVTYAEQLHHYLPRQSTSRRAFTSRQLVLSPDVGSHRALGLQFTQSERSLLDPQIPPTSRIQQIQISLYCQGP